jgi:hypothetical protein
VVFTLPHELAPLALQNKKTLDHLLLQTSAATLLEVARDRKHLGAEIGFFSVLHTWNQKIELHPHVHCVVPAGGLSLDHTHWIRSRENYFLPKPVLREVFRGKFVDALQQAFHNHQLGFRGDLKHLAQPKIFAAWLRLLYRQHWVVYLKRPFGGPEYVLQYLGRYTHRVAISNHRLVSFTDGQVTFRGILLTKTNRSCCPYRSTSSCVVSYCTHCPKASCASATLAFWPIATEPLCCRSASNYWVQ